MERASNSIRILTVNSGSSSLKFAGFGLEPERDPERIVSGQIERIGLSGGRLVVKTAEGREEIPAEARDHESAARLLIEQIEHRGWHSTLAAVGHRVVHSGTRFHKPERATPKLIGELKKLRNLDPDHMPGALALLAVFEQFDPKLVQVACFDTAFHHDMPRVAQMIPIPRRFEARGVRRYGFHGLSYAYLMEELKRWAGDKHAPGFTTSRVILAHLGSGASLAAVRDGHCVDTTMGFTPTSGVMMGTRSGDLDPSLAWFFAHAEGMTADQFQDLVNHQSGLQGVSETCSDMRDLLDRAGSDVRSAEAVELFCYQVRKAIGALAAVLGGVDTLVFSGGIGENAPEIRGRICRGLEFLGIELDREMNAAAHSPMTRAILSLKGSCHVAFIATDEEQMIARATARFTA
jgi:acetate kinase